MDIRDPKPAELIGVWEKVDWAGFSYLSITDESSGTLVLAYPEVQSEVALLKFSFLENGILQVLWFDDADDQARPDILEGQMLGKSFCIIDPIDQDANFEMCFMKSGDIEISRNRAIEKLNELKITKREKSL